MGIKQRDIKLVDACKFCGKKLPKNSMHHWLCHSCWMKHNRRKGISEKSLKKMRKSFGRES